MWLTRSRWNACGHAKRNRRQRRRPHEGLLTAERSAGSRSWMRVGGAGTGTAANVGVRRVLVTVLVEPTCSTYAAAEPGFWYLSTYSCSDSSEIAYMISSVIDRRMGSEPSMP